MKVKVLVAQWCLALCDSMDYPPALQEPSRLLCLWDFPGKNTGAGSHKSQESVFVLSFQMTDEQPGLGLIIVGKKKTDFPSHVVLKNVFLWNLI